MALFTISAIVTSTTLGGMPAKRSGTGDFVVGDGGIEVVVVGPEVLAVGRSPLGSVAGEEVQDRPVVAGTGGEITR